MSVAEIALVILVLSSTLMGWHLRRYYVGWRYGSHRNRVQQVNETIVAKWIAEASFDRLTEEERRGVRAEVDARVKEQFGEDTHVEIEYRNQ